MSSSPLACPFSIVARSSSRISPAVRSRMELRRGASMARARAGFRSQIPHQALLIGGLAVHAPDQVRVGRDEGEIEQLGIGFLLGIDALLLVSLERGRPFHRVERLAGHEGAVEYVVYVHVEVSIDAGGAFGGLVDL